MSNGPETAVLYFRVSTEEQGKKGFSLPEQRRECRARAEAYAAESGRPLRLHEFEDHASGELLERPGLTACREFVRQNRTALFICLDPDRFSRSLNLQLLVADELESRGVRLLFVSHDYQKTAEGKLFFQLRGAISEFEKAKILERTRRGRRGKLASGGIPNHIATWGYRWNQRVKALEIDEEAAPWVRQIFRWYAGGWSYARIAEELTDLGVHPARSRLWYRTTIGRIVRNSTYVGRLVLNRWDCEGNGPLRTLPKAQRPRPRTDRRKPPEQWVTVSVPALIDEALWAQAQARHRGRSRFVQRGVGLLSGLCRCGLCGGKLHYMGHPDRRYLRCRNRYPNEGQAACAWRDVRANAVEAAVWQRVLSWLSDPDLVTRDRTRTSPEDPVRDANAQLALYQRELVSRQQEQARVYRLVVRGLAPPEAEADLDRLAGQIQALTGRLAELHRREVNSSGTVDAAGAPQFGAGCPESDPPAEAARLSHPQRQHLVRLLVHEVVLWPDGHALLTCPRPPA